ncbi:MAG TPA: hypothetical protein VIF64_16190 [Pyrinomonadaceae bacterium]|jgi:hypothetical protein
MKTKLTTIARVIILILLYFICFAAVSGVLFSSTAEQSTPEQSNAAVALLVVSCLNTVVLAYVVLRSNWAGWKLVAAVFVLMFGITTVMPQIETAYFITRLPPGILPRIILAGAIVAAIFSPLAVLILGKRKHRGPNSIDHPSLNLSVPEWTWKVALISILYVIIYFTFGYFIAWQNAAVRAYYGGSDPGSFLAQMMNVPRDTPWLLPLQLVRAMLWTALAVVVIRMLKGGWWEAGLAVALLFAVVMNSQLLIPNAFMPQEVRMVHLLETASSNFLFGLLIVGVLSLGSTPVRAGPEQFTANNARL